MIRVSDFPHMCMLSVIFRCNAKCPCCPYTNSDLRQLYKNALYMPEEIFKKAADEIGGHGQWLRISGGGEPLLHPKMVGLIMYAKERGCKVGMNTNGSLFLRTDVLQLVGCGIDLVEFSVDAGTPEDYRKARPGLNWERLNRSVDLFLEHRTPATKITASAVMQQGIDLEAAEAHWSPKVDVFQRRKYLTWGINDPNQSADPTPYQTSTEPCPWLFERLNIDTRGNIHMCGEDLAGTTQIGSIVKRSIQSIWRGKEFRRLRDLHLANRSNEIPLCRNCPDRVYRSWDHNIWKVLEKCEQKQ